MRGGGSERVRQQGDAAMKRCDSEVVQQRGDEAMREGDDGRSNRDMILFTYALVLHSGFGSSPSGLQAAIEFSWTQGTPGSWSRQQKLMFVDHTTWLDELAQAGYSGPLELELHDGQRGGRVLTATSSPSRDHPEPFACWLHAPGTGPWQDEEVEVEMIWQEDSQAAYSGPRQLLHDEQLDDRVRTVSQLRGETLQRKSLDVEKGRWMMLWD